MKTLKYITLTILLSLISFLFAFLSGETQNTGVEFWCMFMSFIFLSGVIAFALETLATLTED